MSKLPQKLSLDATQTTWATFIEPTLNSPLATPTFLKNVTLASGTNTVNHKLGAKLQGWFPVRYHGSWAQIYDTQDTNLTPALTLTLVASAAVTIDLMVF
jgi:hypothetical protein